MKHARFGARAVVQAAKRPADLEGCRFGTVLFFFLLHGVLALAMYRWRTLSTVHALATVLVGLSWALRKRQSERVAYAAAYITGAELLWRMCGAQMFWEFGKYATCAVVLVSLLRRRNVKSYFPAILYFSLLLPSAWLTISNSTTLEMMREQLSFNLSGPLSLMFSVWFFYNLRLSSAQVQRLFVALIGPVMGVFSIAVFSTLTASSLKFTSESNFVTSGGYGPNQVASILGLGAFVAFYSYMLQEKGAGLKGLFFVSMVLLAAQSALTFSRGGLLGAAVVASIVFLFSLKNRAGRFRLLVSAALIVILASYLVLPGLDAFTGGALSQRFTDSDLAKRDGLIMGDLDVWSENPIFGSGPGMAKGARGRQFGGLAAHTEFSRLLSEHGLFGLAAFTLLMLSGTSRFLAARTSRKRALVASMIGWSFLYMVHNGMRLVAPGFVFGLAFVELSQYGVTSRLRSTEGNLHKGRMAKARWVLGQKQLYPPVLTR